MKLLFDQNLAPALVHRLEDLFPGSEHVHEVGLGEASDRAVWEYARDHGLVIASKDSDFHQLAVLEGLRRRSSGFGSETAPSRKSSRRFGGATLPSSSSARAPQRSWSWESSTEGRARLTPFDGRIRALAVLGGQRLAPPGFVKVVIRPPAVAAIVWASPARLVILERMPCTSVASVVAGPKGGRSPRAGPRRRAAPGSRCPRRR